MRTSRWISGLAVAVPAVVGLFFLQFAAPAQPAKAEAKPIADDRDELANKLMERVALKDPIENMPLKDALQQLSDTYKITLLVDCNSFADNGAAAVAMGADNEPAIFTQRISVPAMKNVRLATVIKEVADQIRGVYLVYPDQIRIVGFGRAYAETKPLKRDYVVERYPITGDTIAVDPDADNDQFVPPEVLIKSAIDSLVTVSFSEKPLEDALKEIGIRTNRTIVVANQAGESRKTPITARFANVGADRAVQSIAEMADLKMVRKGNVLLVTTEARAKDFDPAPRPRPQVVAIGGIGGGIDPNLRFIQSTGLPAGADQSIEDLKKRVAELEKAMAESKQKK